MSLMTSVPGCGGGEPRRQQLPGGGGVGGRGGRVHGEVALFKDVTAEAGLEFVNMNGMSGEKYFVEMMGSGGGFVDYDGDGDLDVYLVQGHRLPARDDDSPYRDRLYRNDSIPAGSGGPLEFRLVDVTEEAGIDARGYGMAVTAGDYDNDGWADLYVSNWGENQLWRNDGDGTFTDVTRSSGAVDDRWSTGAAFVDFDLDGWLDLVIVNYVRYAPESDQPCFDESGRRDYCSPDPYPPAGDRLYRNRGNGTFEDVTLRMGLAGARGQGLGVDVADFDLDGWPDLYVTNDRQENALWINQEGQRFVNRAVFAGAAVNEAGLPEASMGVVASDFDADGDEDLFMTHLDGETNTLYVNDGDGLFVDGTRRSGLGLASRMYTGFGIAAVDFDNDGWLDLFIANGAVTNVPEQVEAGESLPLRQRNQLFRNLGGSRFEEVTPAYDLSFQRLEVSRGVAHGDVDNDGDSDLLIYNNNGPARLLRNEIGQDNPWLGLRLLGTAGRRDMLGARVEVVRRGGPTLWRRVSVSGSYCSSHDLRVLVGLDDDAVEIESVRVHWPGGNVEFWSGLAIDRYHTLVQGQGHPVGVP